jgi:hypothetical protein
MQRVSKEYKASMKELLRERSYMMVSFGLVNQEAMANATIDGNDFTYYSKQSNLFGRKIDGTAYATLENNFSKVDGSMFFLPRETTGTYYDTGLIGSTPINGEDCNLVTDKEEVLCTSDDDEIIVGSGYYELTISLNVVATDIKGLTINFGEIYPVDFDISTSAGQVIEIRGNATSEFVIEDVLENTTYIRFKFYSMKNPNTRLRIYTIQLGFGLTYYNEDIMDSSLSSYVSPICSDVPQIDFSVTLQNYNQYFNVDNPDSAINFLETGQEMYVWYGYKIPDSDTIEWFQAAKLLCSEWESDDYSATIKCQDLYRSMDEEYYKGEYNPDGVSLFDLAVLVFQDAGVSEYYIDPYLKRLKTRNPIPRVRHKEALQIIANAGRCILTQSSTGIPQIKSSFVPEYEFSCNGEAPYSHIENIKEEDPKQEYATYASNYSRVDDNMYNLPEDNTGSLYTGYISEYQSDALGYFKTNPVITITQETECKYYGFKIRFGSALPAEFKITTYNNGAYVEEFYYGKDVISRRMSMVEEFQDFDVMKIEFIRTQEPNNRIVVDYFGFGDITDFTMERKDMTSSPKSIKQELVKRVDVACYTYTKGRAEMETVISEEVDATAGDIVIYYLGNASYGYSATFNGSAGNVQILSTGAYYLKVMFKTTAKATFEVSAYRYTVAEQYASNQLNNRGKVVTWQNPLIGDIEMANEVADWVGQYYNAGIEYEYDSRGNPEIEANDVIYQENAYVDDMKVRVYRHTTNFNGTLSGKVVARRVVSGSA